MWLATTKIRKRLKKYFSIDIKNIEWYYIQGASDFYTFILRERHMPYEKLTQMQSRIIIGTKQTIRAMNNGEVSELYIAEDADRQVTKTAINLAKDLSIPCQYVDSKKRLGNACGIDIGTSTAAVKKQ